MNVKVQNIAYLLLGTNLGSRNKNLFDAIDKIGDKSLILNKSSIYSTAAWGLEDQEDFLNQVVCVKTFLNSFELLEDILEIEQKLGRERIQKWGSRLIDIDILYFNEEIVETPKLIIPHPYIQNRRFTLVPLVEMIPDYIHPKLKKTNVELLDECSDRLEVSEMKKK